MGPPTVDFFLRRLGVASAADFVAQVQNMQVQQTAMGAATAELQGALTRSQAMGQEANERAARAESERDELVRVLANRTGRSGRDRPADGKGSGKPPGFIRERFKTWITQAEDYIDSRFGGKFREALQWAAEHDDEISEHEVRSSY